MEPLGIFALLFVGWIAYLVQERVRLDRHRAAVPLRIAVTGTRGKTTVARRLTAVLSRDGRSVLAKTTGSEAAYLYPDGTVQEIRRLGVPSIIEQKRLLRRGARAGVDVVLAEVMSLHPENHRVEVQKILKPHLVLVTNFRVDHTEAQGKTREEVASVLSLDVPPGARAFVPEEEWDEGFARTVAGAGAEVIRVSSGEAPEIEECGGFGPNQDLIWAVARSLGIREEIIRDGLSSAQEDLGALRSWRIQGEKGGAGQGGGPGDGEGRSWLLVNAFAANDPESTLRTYDMVMEGEEYEPQACIGLLSLRSDRGDRSVQWAEALDSGALGRFRRLYLAGLHGRAVAHRLRNHPLADRLEILKPAPPEGIMDQILKGEGGRGGVLFGFGNIAGLGRDLVRHWRKVGEPHGI